MSLISLDEFHHDLMQDVHGSADAYGRYIEDAFFDVVCVHLVEAGEMDTADRVHYQSPRGIRIDGYGGDPATTGGVLNLVICDFSPSNDVATLTATDMNAIFNRAVRFVEQSLNSTFRDKLEETSPAFGLADLIASRWSHIDKIRVLLVSNRVLSERVDGRDAGEIHDVAVTFGVWDVGRLYRYTSVGRGREDIEIDLQQEFGGGLPALPAHLSEAGYEAYLVVVRGSQLADIYDRWGARLLEQNVRVFLQARGKVNKGIRVTLENDPEMFFAYNNGITATAESVEAVRSHAELRITKIKNLQIVNGGQTTASIHAASKKQGVNLSQVFVQMKLSIVEPAVAIEIVPRISEYANTQNRVNAADFFANHPFHVRIEGFSRRMFAPSPDGTFREAKWFYERARGQYLDARAHLTASQRKKFDFEYPKRQMFTKTDLAKFLMVWRGAPHIVSKGAQKNFAEFAHVIGREWSKNSDAFNEMFYRHLVAKAIMFRRMEALVTEQVWYEGGYRANIVAYSIAKLAHDVKSRKLAVDFEQIWRTQAVPDEMVEALVLVAGVVNDILVAPRAGMRNVTEWAKQAACWEIVQKETITWPRAWIRQLVPLDQQKQVERTAVSDQKVLNGIEAQTAVLQAGAKFWSEVLDWGSKNRALSPMERGILQVAAEMPAKIPTEKQCAVMLGALARFQEDGCQLRLP